MKGLVTMRKRFGLFLTVVLAIATAAVISQGTISPSAYFINPSVLGTVPMCNQFISGLCVYSPSGLVDNGTTLTYKGVQVGLVTSGVTQITAGSGISISGGTGNVTVTNSKQAVSGSGTFTTAASDDVTVTGATASSHCVFSPTNVTASADLLADFVSATGTNTVTITHSATTASGGTVSVLCTLN